MLFPRPGKPGLWLELLAALDEDPTSAGFSSFQILLRGGDPDPMSFFFPTLLGGDFSCSFGYIGVLQSVSN